MTRFRGLLLGICVFFASAAQVGAEALTRSQATAFEFSHFLRNRPLELGRLLGKHLSEVAPEQSLADLPVAEEFKNPSIRYGVFARPPYMKGWDFLTGDYCVSSYSMFLMFFNKGFVFKVELRYISDTFQGVVKPDDPGFCADHTPIFEKMAAKLGGTVIENRGDREIKQYFDTYVVTLVTGRSGIVGISWDLRGGPSLRNF
jgi:hypothetical protein